MEKQDQQQQQPQDNNSITTPQQTNTMPEMPKLRQRVANPNIKPAEESTVNPYSKPASPEEIKKAKEQLQDMAKKLPMDHQKSVVYSGEKGKRETLYKSKIKPKELVFFKNCHDCHYTIATTCTKVMIEDCKNCTITFTNGKILTNTVEIWKCEDLNVVADTEVFTMQLDVSKKINLIYNHQRYYQSVIWAGVEDLHIQFEDKKEHNLRTGYAHMKEKHPDLQEHTDQIIVRFLNGILTSELVVRLANGYPTTDREADEWDKQQLRKEEAMEAQLKSILKMAPALGIKNITKKGDDGKKIKIKPNEPCPCKSGKKYKKCCGNDVEKIKERTIENVAKSPIIAPTKTTAPTTSTSANGTTSNGSTAPATQSNGSAQPTTTETKN